MGDNLLYPAPIRTGREPSAAGPATAAPRLSSSGQSNSNYQIPAHIPPGYVLSSPELYESPSAATRAYQRNTYTTSAGGAGVLATAGGAASKTTAAAAAAAAGDSSAKGVSTSIAGAAALISSSSDGQAGLLPLSTGAGSKDPAGRQRVSWGNRTPLRKDASWFALSILLLYVAAVIYYLYVRIAFTLDMQDRWYSIIVLVVECIGISAVLPYGLINVCHTHPTGSAGLPADDGTLLPDKTFTVRVLVPCYAEPLSVVSATVTAAMEADLPSGVRRELYLCDDGKDATKKAWLEATYGEGSSSSSSAAAANGRVHYVSSRTRAKGEINGKSANLNKALKNLIYPEYASRPGDIPVGELVVVFDADMQAKPNFFCKLLEVMTDDSIALVLSPQGFSNVDPATDIFNNTNQQFWEYVLPGLDALGYIACTGTNFVLRGRALASVGWFPEYCITEDYALSMELKAAGYKGAYMAEYLAVGEAPTEMRNVMRQRSRWTKGHMQVFFSRRCPLLRGALPLLHKLLYTNGTYSYFCTVVTTWAFLLVPFMSLMFKIQPVKFGQEFALAATLYQFANSAVMNYFHVAEHMRGSWMATVSNYLLAYTYVKAIGNTLLAKLHVKKKAGFKPTEKTAGGGSGTAGTSGATAQIQAALMNRLTSLTRRFNHTTVPQLYQPPSSSSSSNARKVKEDECVPDKLVMSLCLSLCLNTVVLGLHQAYMRGGLTAWIMVPIFWAVYNAIPPLLFFGYVFFPGTDSLHNLCFWLRLVSVASGLGAVVCLWFVVPVVY